MKEYQREILKRLKSYRGKAVRAPHRYTRGRTEVIGIDLSKQKDMCCKVTLLKLRNGKILITNVEYYDEKDN